MPPGTSPSASSPDVAEAPAERRHLAAGVLSATGAQVATIAAATVASILIARAIGPSGNGTVALALSLTGIASQVFAFGLATGVAYLISSGRWSAGSAVRTAQLAGVALGTAGALVTAALYATTSGSVFEGLSWSVVLAAAVSVPLALSWSLSAAVAIAEERYELYGGCFFGQALSMLVLIAVLVGPFEAEGAVWGVAASHGLTAVVALGAVRRGATGGGVDLPALRGALRFGMQTWVAELLALLAYRLDLFILNGYTSPATVGVYSVAVSITALAWVLPGALQAVVLPRAAHLDGEAEEADLLAIRAVRHTVLLLVPTALVLALVLAVAVPVLYGDRFDDSVRLGLLLLPGCLALSVTKVVTAVLIGRGLPRYAVITTLLVTPLTIAAYFVAIPSLEADGAALATTASYAASLVVSLWFFVRVTRLSPGRLVPRREDLQAYAQAAGVLRLYVRDRLPRRS